MLQYKKVLNNFSTNSLENFLLLPALLRMHEISKISLALKEKGTKM